MKIKSLKYKFSFNAYRNVNTLYDFKIRLRDEPSASWTSEEQTKCSRETSSHYVMLLKNREILFMEVSNDWLFFLLTPGIFALTFSRNSKGREATLPDLLKISWNKEQHPYSIPRQETSWFFSVVNQKKEYIPFSGLPLKYIT